MVWITQSMPRLTIEKPPESIFEYSKIEVVEPRGSDGLRRIVERAPCGCVWCGWEGIGGYSDGAYTRCDEHYVPELEVEVVPARKPY